MRRLVTFLVIFFSFISVWGQNVKSFTDLFGNQGEVRFSGTYSDTVLPKNGRYEIRWRDVDSTTLRTYLVRGNTKNHLPHGKWKWEQADWNYSVSPGNTIRPVFQTSGKRMIWEGEFVNGQAQGKWIFNMDSITADGKSNGVYVKMEMDLSKGKPVRNVVIENKIPGQNFTLKGLCNDKGIASDTWTYEYMNPKGIPVKELHVHRQGLLTEVQVFEGGNKKTRVFDRNVTFLKNKTLYDSTNEIRIGDARFEVDEYGGRASQLLHDHFNDYYLRGWKLGVFPFEFMRDVPIFKQLEYPIQDNEQVEIEKCRELVSSQLHQVQKHLGGNVIIHRSRSAELDVLISYLQATEKRLLLIDSLLNVTDEHYFTYKNRYEQGVLNWIRLINANNVVKGEVYDSLELSLPTIKPLNNELAIFSEIHSFLKANEELLTSHYSIIDEAETLLKREGELKDLEDLMVEHFEQLQLVFSDAQGIASEINTKWVKGRAQYKLQEYAKTDDYNDALLLGNRFLTLMDSISSWNYRAGEFDSMLVVLQAQYTYLAYNPYTGDNDIEIKIKKRLFSNVTTNLWPYMRSQIDEETDWMKWGELYNRQFAVYHFLLKFATREDKQAKRLNKRFRKEKKPERLLKLILNHLDDEG